MSEEVETFAFQAEINQVGNFTDEFLWLLSCAQIADPMIFLFLPNSC